MDYINTRLRSYTIILFISTLSFTAGSDINCNGKAFHCVNATHFKICVDLGGGVSTTVDEFLIQCPRNTVCKQYNLFECEYEITPTLPAVTIQSEVTNEQFQTSDHSVWEQLDVTTLFPTKQQGMQLSEKYYNNVNVTPASFKASFLDDAVTNPSNSSNTKDLFTSSNSNTTLNISRSIDKELAFSTTESGIDVTLPSPNNINKLETDITVGSKYNTENPIFFTTIQDRRTADSFKSESLEPLNQNSSDLDARLTVIKSKNQVSSLSELPLSATGSLLPDNISEKSLQENAPRISNINHLIKSDNKSLERNPDILIKYNMTQLNNSDNYKEHRNINSSIYSTNTSTVINTLNSTTLYVIPNEIFPSNVSNINKKSTIDSVITTESPGQHLAEITTASTVIVPRTTNHFSSHMSLYTAEAIETFLNDGLNTTTNLRNLSVTDADIMISTTNIPDTSVVKTNEMPSQIKNSGLNHDISSIVLTNSILDEKSTTASNRPQISDPKSSNDNEILDLKNKFEVNVTTELNSVNISQYLTTTEPYMYHKRNDIPISSTSKSEITAPIIISEILYLSSKEATQVHNASQIDNTLESELVSTKTQSKNQSNSSFLPLSNISLFTTAGTKSASFDKIIVRDNSFTSVDMLPVLTTPKMSNGVMSLKSLSDFTVKNETSPKPVTMTVAADLDNNIITTTEVNDIITAKISKGVTNLKLLSDLTVKNETSPKPVVMTDATDLDNNNTTTTEANDNITAKLSKGVRNLKPLSDLPMKNKTSPKPVAMTDATELDNNNITITEVNNNITEKISSGFMNLKPLSDLTVKNETSKKTVITTVATHLNNNNTTTTEVNNNITAKISQGIMNLKSLSEITVKNETSLKPVMVTVATDLDNNITTTTEVNDNITAKISQGVTNLKSLSELTVKNETSPKPVMISVATDLDNNIITTTEVNDNITAKISKGVTNLKPLSDLPLKNETSLKPVVRTDATDFDNNNTTTTEVNNNITAKISSGFTNLKSLSELTVKNVTSPKPVMMTVATDLDNNIITTIEVNDNVTAKISKGVTNLKPLSDLPVKNETSLKPVVMTDATELDNNNITISEVNNNITEKISSGFMNLKPLSDLSVKNETSKKTVITTVATHLDNNNTTTTEVNDNTTAKISQGVTNLKSLSELTVKNETSPKPVMMAVATDLDNNIITTKEVNDNITAKISKGVTNLKPLSDLPLKNETSPKPVVMTAATELDNNNITITEVNNNITAKISSGFMNLKPLSDLIVKNDTSKKTVITTVATNLDNNNTTTTEVNNNIIAKISQGVTNLKSLSELTVKNETLLKPVMLKVASDFDNNNVTTTVTRKIIISEISNGVTSLKSMSVLTAKNETFPKLVNVTVVTVLDNNNIKTTETNNNITAEIYNRVTTLNSVSDLTPTLRSQESIFELLSVTDTVDSFHKENALDHQSLNDSNTSLSSFTKIPDYIFKNIHLNTDSVALNPSTDSVTRELERNTTSIIISLPTALDKPTLLTNNSSGGLDNNITHNNDDIKFVNNFSYEINKTLSYNSTLINRTSEIYQTATDSDTGFNRMESLTSTTAFESDNSTDVTYNTIAITDVLSEYRVVSNNNKNIENTLKLESRITKPSTYSDSNTSSKHVISSETRNVTTLTPESANKDINEKQVIYKNTRNNDQILSRNNIGNPILTKLTTEDILITKLVKNNNFSLSVALNVTNTNNNITDKKNWSFKDIKIKHNLVTKDLVEKSLTEGVINTDFNYTDKNVVSYVSNNSKTVPLTYLSSSLTKPPLTDIYNASHSYFNENISRTLTFENITASKKYNESENKDSSQTNNNGLAPAHAISNIEHEENKTEHLLPNTYKQVTTTAKKVNGTTLKELSYNYSEPSSYVKYDFSRKNITTSADKRTTPNEFYSTKGSDFNKNNSIMTNKSININNDINRSELADYLHLSEIPNSKLSGNIIRPLLIVQEEVNNTTSLHTGNGNLSLLTGHGLQGYVSDRINKSKTSEINNVNKSEIYTRVKNITSSNNFSKDIVNTTLLSDATKPSKTHNRNVPEINNYTKDLNATSDTLIPANNLLSSTLSQTNSIKNKTHPAESATALEISKIPSEFDESSQPTWSLNISKTTRWFLNKTELEVIISKQENNTISEHTNRTNRVAEKQLGNGKSTLRVGNGVTKNIRNNTKQHQNSFTTPISNNNYSDTKSRNMRRNLEFNCTKRGKYSDANDCNKFYLCNGRVKPVIGICPKDTVFSEYLKQCTKNLTHCIRNNQFKCTAVGRFNNILCNNTYFICVKKNSSFIRFTLKCQRGYYLDKINVKCTPELINISISDENSSKTTKESSDKSEENGGLSVNSKNYFECEKEGKFNDPHDCRKYYVCEKGRKSTFRRNIKKCDSDEVFHKKKKKCVDGESYECDTQ